MDFRSELFPAVRWAIDYDGVRLPGATPQARLHGKTIAVRDRAISTSMPNRRDGPPRP